MYVDKPYLQKQFESFSKKISNIFAKKTDIKLNTSTNDGYVASSDGQPDKVWATDAEGNPNWQETEEIEYMIDDNGDLYFSEGRLISAKKS